jgi:membrane protein YdbS with pleckstrin-like domain
MPKIDELKARMDWLKEAVKILVAMLLAAGAGVAKLYLDSEIGVLFISGIVFMILVSVVIVAIVIKLIKQSVI